MWRDYRDRFRTGMVPDATTSEALQMAPYRLLDDPARPPRWGTPFARRGETLPLMLSSVAESVLASTVRRPEEAIALVSHTVNAAARGEFPDDETAFAVTVALCQDQVQGRFVVPYLDHDPQRVEQLSLALHRGSDSAGVRVRLAALIAASALLRQDVVLAVHALSHTGDNPLGRAIMDLYRRQISGHAAREPLTDIAAAFTR